MKQQLFEQKFTPQWQQFEMQLRVLEKESLPSDKAADQRLFADEYRSLCHQLSLARARSYSPRLVEYLNELVLRGHQQLYQRKVSLLSQFQRFVVLDFPQVIRREWKLCLVASALMYLPAFILTFLVWRYPELVYTVVNAGMLENFESMYDPMAEHVGRVRDAGTDFQMFGHYIQNNISIGFRTFAGGIMLGIGSIFFLVFNGSLFGALAGHIINIEYQSTFFTFVIGHGSFELTAIALAGAAGLKLGFAILSPGQLSRIDALKAAAKVAMKIMYGVILMLVIAAFIEAFWSSSGLVHGWGKYTVGAILWALVLVYFVRMGRSADGA